ncbi:hypothetical protein [Streptomyces sp. NPDC050485]|uniref:hypothetical protein n=1 Tax=Streptomyces sp. NPDC050485 TaxID=3365617 RepID=UPI0037B343BB
MTKAWEDYALHLREVLRQCAIDTPVCLPGEVRDCGNDYAHHCVGYLAMLRARAEDGLWHIDHGQGDGRAMAEHIYGRWRAELAGQRDCEQCRTSTR